MTIVATRQTAGLPFDTAMCRGVDSVAGASARLSALADSLPSRSVTAGWPWLAASLSSLAKDAEPWLLTVCAGDDLVAAAVLIDDMTGSIRRTQLAGTEEEHRGALLARDDAAAAQLGVALADALMGEFREFSIGPLTDGPAVAALTHRLPIGVVVDDVSIPVVHVAGGADIGMSHGVSRTLRKARNRMIADGIRPDIATTSDPHEITAILPLLESISRDRDLAAGRSSPLDDNHRRRLWQRRVLTLAATGLLRLVTLRLKGELAAYVLGIHDGDCYRVLEGRYVGRFARYAPGRVLEAAVLDSVVESSDLMQLDWMTGIAPETLLAANALDPMVVVRGRT